MQGHTDTVDETSRLLSPRVWSHRSSHSFRERSIVLSFPNLPTPLPGFCPQNRTAGGNPSSALDQLTRASHHQQSIAPSSWSSGASENGIPASFSHFSPPIPITTHILQIHQGVVSRPWGWSPLNQVGQPPTPSSPFQGPAAGLKGRAGGALDS